MFCSFTRFSIVVIVVVVVFWLGPFANNNFTPLRAAKIFFMFLFSIYSYIKHPLCWIKDSVTCWLMGNSFLGIGREHNMKRKTGFWGDFTSNCERISKLSPHSALYWGRKMDPLFSNFSTYLLDWNRLSSQTDIRYDLNKLFS